MTAVDNYGRTETHTFNAHFGGRYAYGTVWQDRDGDGVRDWVDANGNGRFDANEGEPGMDGWAVESVKAAEDVISPVSGEVVAVNDDLSAAPEGVNSDPYGAWFYKVQPANLAELDGLMGAAEYEAFVAEAEAAG